MANAISNYEDSIIMSTAINENGLFAVCTEEAGYKGSVTVYDSELTPLYKWYCASGDLICAALSRDGTLAVLTENERGSITTGKSADFILVDKDVLSCPVMQIHTAKTAATFFEGKKVFESVPGE